MKNLLSTTLIMVMLTITPMKASLAGSDPFLGEITIFSSNFAPRGYAFCEGQLLNISQNAALYSLLGTKYGGDGRVTFALPNLKAGEKLLNGSRYIISLQGIYPPRN